MEASTWEGRPPVALDVERRSEAVDPSMFQAEADGLGKVQRVRLIAWDAIH